MRSHLRNTVMVAYVPLAELSDSQSKRGTRQTGAITALQSTADSTGGAAEG